MPGKLLTAICFAVLSATTAKAATMNMWLFEDSGDLVVKHQGAFDLTGLSLALPQIFVDSLATGTPSQGMLAVTTGAPRQVYSVNILGPAYGTGGEWWAWPSTSLFEISGAAVAPVATSFSGDSFGFNATLDRVSIPLSYVSGEGLSGIARVTGYTLSAIGAENGSYQYLAGNNTINLYVGPVAVPVPASLPMLLVGLVTSFAYFRRVKRRANVNAV